jgi:glycosyltransferase involved in cell wall biosynthesis
VNFLSLYLSPHYRTGGQRRYMELLGGFCNAGHRVVLIHRADSSVEIPSGVVSIGLDSGSGTIRGRDGAFALKLRFFFQQQLLNNSDVLGLEIDGERIIPDIIFQFGESSVRSIRVLKRQLRIPVIVALRNNWIEGNRRVRDAQDNGIIYRIRGRFESFRDHRRERAVREMADHVVFQSRFDRDEFCQRQECPEGFTSIVANSTRVSWFDPEYAAANTSSTLRTVIFVGSEDPRKGLQDLLEAFSRIRARGIDIRLRLIGHFKPDFGKRLKKLGLYDGVEIGEVVQSAFPELAASDLFVIPSLYDSFPNTLLEALFCGTPAIGSDVAGIRVMLDTDDLLFPPGDQTAIENLLLRLANDSFYSEAAAWCRSRAKAFDFDWTAAWLQRIEAVLNAERNADRE